MLYQSHEKKIRVRFWTVDDTGDEPKLIYTYQEGTTEDDREKAWLSVYWKSGGLSMIRNDHSVTWLEE